MKKFIIPVFLTTAVAFIGCDKVDNPIKPAVELDTTLFPGLWSEYVYPVWTQNTNTQRNVMIEDYTGHRCPNCPAAAAMAKSIEDANPSQIYVVSIHASAGGLSDFQYTYGNCGDTVLNPEWEFCEVLYCDEGVEYGTFFNGAGYGFTGNPSGNTNRKSFGGSQLFYFWTEWDANTQAILNENDLKVNIQAQSNYYTETNGLFLHTEIEFLEDLNAGNYSTVVYVIEDELETWQDSMGVHLEEYHHHNILRGCIDGLPWGRSLSGDFAAGAKHYFDYSYELPSIYTNNDLHLLIYVYDVDTYEVLQVIKHEF